MITGQLRLDAGHELHEPRLYTEHVRRPVDDQAERAGPAIGQRPGRAVGLEAYFLGDGQDALPGGRGNTRLAVERERHRRLGPARAARDVGDGRTFHAMPPRDRRSARRAARYRSAVTPPRGNRPPVPAPRHLPPAGARRPAHHRRPALAQASVTSSRTPRPGARSRARRQCSYVLTLNRYSDSIALASRTGLSHGPDRTDMIARAWAAAIRRPLKFPEEIFPHAQKCCQDRH